MAGREPATDRGLMTAFRTCMGVATSPQDRLGLAVSPTFVDAAGNTISSAASRYSAQHIQDDVAAVVGFASIESLLPAALTSRVVQVESERVAAH
jgi:hypothetical protein